MADNLRIITCPACGKEMKKIYIEDLEFNVDICADGCGGIYFDNREYTKFDEQHEDASLILNELKGKQFDKVNESAIRNCPFCGVKMVKNFASSKKSVQIDECYNCGGKFLDYGELEKIREEFVDEAKRIGDFNEAFNRIFYEDFALVEAESEKSVVNKNWLFKFVTNMVKDSL